MTELTANIITAIEGLPKSGKTHFAMTFPDPIKVFSFDMGCKIVAAKFPDKVIDIDERPLPVVDSLELEDAGFLEFWQGLRDDVYKSFEGEYKTVVVDTATALWEIVRYAFNEKQGRAVGKGGMPRDYGEPNAWMYGVIMRAQVAGVNLVLTHHLKDEYVADKPTGNRVIDGWRRTEGLADVVLMTNRVGHTIKSLIKDCRFDLELCGFELPDNCGYTDLAALLGL